MYTDDENGVNPWTMAGRRRLPRAGACGSIDRMSRGMSTSAALVLAAAAACSGKPHGPQVVITKPPDPVTRATLAGPLCEADVCKCRDDGAPADGGAGEPADGVKRFEFRVGPSEHELWVTLDDMVLYKSPARAEDCFYVDLMPGNHAVGLRASHPGGISAAVKISEYAVGTKSWYDTFAFSCGAPGVCAHDELDEQKADFATSYKRGIHDPCGSVRIKGLAWDTGVAPDQLHPDDLAVQLTMQIYSFAPAKRHGDPTCAGRFEQ